jgi:nitrogen regulatory protein PII
VRERLGILGIAVDVEKEIINIVVSADQQDHVFERMYLAGDLDTPGKGIMYVTPLDKAATHIPREVLTRLGIAPAEEHGGEDG